MSELPKSESLQSTESLELLRSSESLESQAMESILEGEKPYLVNHPNLEFCHQSTFERLM